MIGYNYIEEENLVHVERTEKIELHDVLDYIKSLDENFNDIRNLDIIDDHRESTLNYDKEAFPIFLEELSLRLNKYKQVRHAVVVDKPLETALGYIFEKASQNLSNYTCKTFSTPEAAKKWLKE